MHSKDGATSRRFGGFYAKGAKRPPQKFFNKDEFEKNGLMVESKRSLGILCYVHGSQSYSRGFLIKEVSAQTMLKTDNIKPTLEELQKFR